MKPERALYIIQNSTMGELRYSFPRSHTYKGGIVHNDGLTELEDTFIREVWRLMPGYTCYYDALVRIATENLPPEPESLADIEKRVTR